MYWASIAPHVIILSAAAIGYFWKIAFGIMA